MSDKKLKKVPLIVVKTAVSGAILTFIFISVELSRLHDIISGIKLDVFLLGLALLTIQILIGSFRWKVIIDKGIGLKSFATIVKLYWIGNIFSQILPSNFGGDAIKIYYLSGLKENITKSAQSVIADRVIGLLVLLLIAVGTYCYRFIIQDLTIMTTSLPFDLILFISSIIFLSLLLGYIFRKIGFIAIGIEFLIGIAYNIWQVNYHRINGPVILGTSLSIHLITIMATFLISQSLELSISFTQLLWTLPSVLLISCVPITVSGWGVREGLMIVMLGQYGITLEESLSLSVMLGSSLAVVSLPGLVFWLVFKTSKSKVEL